LLNPDHIKSEPFEVDFFGYRYTGDLSNSLDWQVYMLGAYAMHELSLLRDMSAALRTPGSVLNFYDIGANIGHHTLFMSKYADNVKSFEPYGAVRAKANQKIEQNKVANVVIYPYALGAEDGEFEYAMPSGSNQGSGSFRIENDDRPKTTLTVKHGDVFFMRENLPKMDIIKMDVEGFESVVLNGLHDRLRSDRPIIMSEISGEDRSGFKTLDGLSKVLYDDFEIYEVIVERYGGPYVLTPCHFETAEEILIVPKELRPKLKNVLPPL